MTTLTGAGPAPLACLADPCPKCWAAAEVHTLLWIPPAGDEVVERPLAIPYVEPREHMRVTCGRCGFVWAAAPADADGAPEAA